jgi:hypothetical protein
MKGFGEITTRKNFLSRKEMSNAPAFQRLVVSLAER